MSALTFLLPLAAATQQPAANQFLQMVPMLVGGAGLIYFMMIRPQQQQKKKLDEMLSRVNVGARVLTSSGIYGTVRGVSEKTFKIAIANGVEVEMVRGAVVSVVDESEPAKIEKVEKSEKKAER